MACGEGQCWRRWSPVTCAVICWFPMQRVRPLNRPGFLDNKKPAKPYAVRVMWTDPDVLATGFGVWPVDAYGHLHGRPPWRSPRRSRAASFLPTAPFLASHHDRGSDQLLGERGESVGNQFCASESIFNCFCACIIDFGHGGCLDLRWVICEMGGFAAVSSGSFLIVRHSLRSGSHRL